MAVVYGGKKFYPLALPAVDASQGVVPWVYTPTKTREFQPLYYYMRNFCNLIGLEQWYFSLI